MKALKYHLERVDLNSGMGRRSDAHLTEIVNNIQARLNDDQHVIGDNPPYWELDSTTSLGDAQGGQLLFTFVCWQERF